MGLPVVLYEQWRCGLIKKLARGHRHGKASHGHLHFRVFLALSPEFAGPLLAVLDEESRAQTFLFGIELRGSHPRVILKAES